MPHLPRMFAALCAIALTLVSLPTTAGIADKDLPLLVGEKARVIYTAVGVKDSGSMATSFHCTSTERTGGKIIRLGIEVFDHVGVLANDVTLGPGQTYVAPGNTVTVSTQDTMVFVENEIINTGTVRGSARILATSKNLLCSAMLVDPVNDPPTSMVMLPVFRTTKQKGM